MRHIVRAGLRCLAALLSLEMLAQTCPACSVLSHEAIVDALWDVRLKPLLAARFPGATEADLKRAHGYAYGGAIIQDLGYYPHGSEQFSDMAHYVRTGDFITSLINEAQTLNEMSFALGALTHQVSDINVHEFATNRCEPMLYPKLERKYGSVITYEQNPGAHLKTEFGFDVLEVAKGRFAPEKYHDFIGFFVAKPVLERAFYDTYGLRLSESFPNFDRTIGSYRNAVSKVIPTATRIAWAQRQKDIQKSEPGITRSRFVYVMRRSSYEQDWGKDYDRPGMGDHLLGALLRVIPPIGPLRALRFRMPTPEVEKIFMQSFDKAVFQAQASLDEEKARRLRMRNLNYDLGRPVPPGSYKLQDRAYSFWLDKLTKSDLRAVSPTIRQTILSYYRVPDAPMQSEKHAAARKRLVEELRALQAVDTAGATSQAANALP